MVHNNYVIVIMSACRDFVSVRHMEISGGSLYAASKAIVTSMKPKQPGKVRSDRYCMYVCMYVHTYVRTYVCTYVTDTGRKRTLFHSKWANSISYNYL